MIARSFIREAGGVWHALHDKADGRTACGVQMRGEFVRRREIEERVTLPLSAVIVCTRLGCRERLP